MALKNKAVKFFVVPDIGLSFGKSFLQTASLLLLLLLLLLRQVWHPAIFHANPAGKMFDWINGFGRI